MFNIPGWKKSDDKQVEMTFDAIIKTYFTDDILNHGYKKLDGHLYGRMVGKDMFQYINFQRPAKGLKALLPSFNIFFLFEKRSPDLVKYLSYSLGHRFSYFNNGMRIHDTYNTKNELKKSVAIVSGILNNHIYKWLDDHTSFENLSVCFKDRGLRQPDDQWANISLAYLHLRNGDIEKALEIAKAILKEGSIHEGKLFICKELIAELESGRPVSDYLDRIITENKTALNLNNI